MAARRRSGINVSKRYGYATVVSVVPGRPADKAGLSDGDIIEAIGTRGHAQSLAGDDSTDAGRSSGKPSCRWP